MSGQFECGRVLLASKTSVQDEAGESSVLIGRSISLVDRSVDSGGLIFEHFFRSNVFGKVCRVQRGLERRSEY